jgi:hypothetical protein
LALSYNQKPSDGRKSIGHLLVEHVPAWITAIVSVISLVIGFGAGYGTSKVQNAAPSPAVTVYEPGPGSSSPLPGSNGETSSAPAVRHRGSLLLNGGTSADLDSKANNWDINALTSDITLTQYNTGDVIDSAGQLAQLDNSPPDYRGCSSTTNYIKSLSLSNLNVGANFCVQTNEKRWSLIHVTNVSQDSISMDVTTWELVGNQ